MAARAKNRPDNPWLLMAFIAIPVFVGSLDLTVVSAFLPELLAELAIPFDSGLDSASWVVTGYLLAYSVSLMLMGRLSDLIGRRRVYIACLLTFIIGSVLVAIAHQAPTDWLYGLYRRLGERPDPAMVNLQVIVLGRVVQALGAGALVPVSLALASDIFPPQKRARALGLVAAIDTLGWVLGHLYGGIFVQVMPWQGLFWINVPLGLLALAAVMRALRHWPRPKAQGGFDWIGAALMIGALTCLTLGLGVNLEFSSAGGFEDLSPLPDYALPMLIAAAVFFLAFVWVEARIKTPLIDLTLFRRKNLALACLINLAVGYALFIGLVSVPILVNVRLEQVADLRAAALQVGLLLSTLTVPMALAAMPGAWLSDRIGIRSTLLLGLILGGLGFLTVWQSWGPGITEALIALQMAVIGVGIGLTFAPLGAVIINAAPESERGAASALVIVLRLIGMTFSVSSLTAYGLHRVHQLTALTSASNTAGLLNAYAEATIKALGEMGLIGALVCGLALMPAWFLSRQADFQRGAARV